MSYLALTQRPHTREWLCSFLWPESDNERARGALRFTLGKLRRLVGKTMFDTNRKTIALAAGADITIDLLRFEHLASSSAPADWEEAINLYQGDFLAGFTLPDAPAFDEWHYFERERLQHLLQTTLRSLIGVTSGEKALQLARRWVALDTLSEEAHATVIRIHQQLGQREAGLRQYKTLQTLLEKELGVAPSATITQLADELRTTQPIATPLIHTKNLPRYEDKFVNRTVEKARIKQFLMQPQQRLLTLVGYGGVGKTRLAIEAARQTPIDAVFVPLAQANSAEMIFTSIANALGLSLVGVDSSEKMLLDTLRPRQILLIFDNFEQLIMTGRTIVTRWLDRLPNLRLLITSRIRLNLREEHILPVSGLAVADTIEAVINKGIQDSAIELFVNRTQQLIPNFDFVACSVAEQTAILRLATLVEGLPLAMELAASWMRVLSCTQLVTEIEKNIDLLASAQSDRPYRHHRVRAVFDYSYSLLPDTLQQLLANLSVLRGAFNLTAAQAVCNATLHGLATLVDHSLLIVAENNRFRLHELVRQFASEQLDPKTRQALDTTHAHYFSDLIEQRRTDFTGAKQVEALQVVSDEMPNVRAAWRWATTQQAAAQLDQLRIGLQNYYLLQGRFRDGAALFDKAITQLTSNSAEVQSILCRLLIESGVFKMAVGDMTVAHSLLTRSQTLAQQINDASLEFMALRGLSNVARQQGQFELAQHAIQNALTLAQQQAIEPNQAFAYTLLGSIYIDLGQFDKAIVALEQASDRFSNNAYDFGLAQAFLYQGKLFMLQGEDGSIFLQESYTLCEKLDHPLGCVRAAALLSQQALANGKRAEAQQWINRAKRHHVAPIVRLPVMLQHAETLLATGYRQLGLTKLHNALMLARTINAPPLQIETAVAIVKHRPAASLNAHVLARAVYSPFVTWTTRQQAQTLASRYDRLPRMALPMRQLLDKLSELHQDSVT